MNWQKQPLTREVARGLRAATRKTPAIDGHRFVYTDLKELWTSPDGTHLLCTHASDPVWQYWHLPPEGGWQLVAYRHSRAEVTQIAEDKARTPLVCTTEAGKYVIAWRPGGRTIRVRCLSSDPTSTQAIFERLGYETNVEDVVA